MAEPFDTLAAQLTDVIERLAAGSVGSFDASAEIAAIMSGLAPDQWAQLTQVIQVMGRVDGMLFVTGTPATTLGTVGSTAVDLVNGKFWPPKTELGWTVAPIDFVGATGPAGTITSVTAEGLPAGSVPEVVPGGTASARTFLFRLPKGDTGDAGDIVEVTVETLPAGSDATVTRGGTPGERTLHLGIPRGDTGTDTAAISLAVQERVDLFSLTTFGQAAAFIGRAADVDFQAGYARYGLDVAEDILDLSDVTLTRATGGYAPKLDGTYQWFGANVPRETDWGLTIERASTNLIPRAAPTVAHLSTATNCADVTAPAGAPISGLAWIALDNTAGKTAISYQSLTHAASVEHRFSVFVYCPDGIAPVPSTSAGSGDFTLIIAGQLALTGIIVERIGTSNFWRCSGSYVTNATPSGASGIIRYSGQNTRTMYFSMRQMEVGDRATTPIITTGSSATRAADVLRHADVAFDAPFILYARFAFLGAPSNIGAGGRTVMEVSAPGGNNQARLANIGGGVGGQLVAGGTDQGQPTVAGTVAINTPVEVAMLVQPNRLIVAKNGALGTPDTSATMPSVSLTRLDIGCRWDGSGQLDGVLMQLAAIPLPLPGPDSLPQNMTS